MTNQPTNPAETALAVGGANMGLIGGGGMMDIGCYCVSFARWLFDAEPKRVVALADIDAAFGTDRLASGLLDFGRGAASFTCSTQLSSYQRIKSPRKMRIILFLRPTPLINL